MAGERKVDGVWVVYTIILYRIIWYRNVSYIYIIHTVQYEKHEYPFSERNSFVHDLRTPSKLYIYIIQYVHAGMQHRRQKFVVELLEMHPTHIHTAYIHTFAYAADETIREPNGTREQVANCIACFSTMFVFSYIRSKRGSERERWGRCECPPWLCVCVCVYE